MKNEKAIKELVEASVGESLLKVLEKLGFSEQLKGDILQGKQEYEQKQQENHSERKWIPHSKFILLPIEEQARLTKEYRQGKPFENLSEKKKKFQELEDSFNKSIEQIHKEKHSENHSEKPSEQQELVSAKDIVSSFASADRSTQLKLFGEISKVISESLGRK